MTTPQDDEPLDPKVEAIRKRLVRLLAVSGGIMVVGLMTVIIAVIYRLGGDSDSVEPQMRAVQDGASPVVTQLSVDGDRIVMVIRYPNDGRTIVRVQSVNGTVISETELR